MKAKNNPESRQATGKIIPPFPEGETIAVKKHKKIRREKINEKLYSWQAEQAI